MEAIVLAGKRLRQSGLRQLLTIASMGAGRDSTYLCMLFSQSLLIWLWWWLRSVRLLHSSQMPLPWKTHKKTIPSEQRSAVWSYSCLRPTRQSIQAGDPTLDVRASVLAPSLVLHPKSPILATFLCPIKIFYGFRSLCTIPCSCAQANPSAICWQSASFGRCWGICEMKSGSDPPWQNSVTMQYLQSSTMQQSQNLRMLAWSSFLRFETSRKIIWNCCRACVLKLLRATKLPWADLALKTQPQLPFPRDWMIWYLQLNCFSDILMNSFLLLSSNHITQMIYLQKPYLIRASSSFLARMHIILLQK